jgi:hypothetical protein
MRRREVLLGTLAGGLTTVSRAEAPPAKQVGTSLSGMQQPAETIDLWPGEAPGMPSLPLTETMVERSTDPQMMDRFINGISRSRMPDHVNCSSVRMRGLLSSAPTRRSITSRTTQVPSTTGLRQGCRFWRIR